jgi:hypothetical protein
MEFTFSNKAKRFTFILMGLGLVGTIVGALTGDMVEGNRFWANLFTNGFFFFSVALGALFFLALQYATETAWSVMLKRVLEGVMSFIPIGAVVLVVVFLAGSLHGHHLFHWMDGSLYDKLLENGEPNPNYDAIIAGKAAYLNQPFFWIRTLVYLTTFVLFARFFRKQSLLEDQVGGLDIHKKNYQRSAVFLVLFAVFSTTMSWDWIMSIDTHWFSTLFGWYVFSGIWVSAVIFITLLVFYLKKRGYLPQVNESHIHDLGKWMFALSFLWSYLWFSQFLLIWYSNIPEEVTYYITRIEDFKIPFFSMFIINFTFPMLILMSRDSKRNYTFLTVVGLIIFVGHWLDVYLMITPGSLFHWYFGLLEIGMFLFFLGLFIFVVLNTLTKAPLSPANHPYLDESVHHEI